MKQTLLDLQAGSRYAMQEQQLFSYGMVVLLLNEWPFRRWDEPNVM